MPSSHKFYISCIFLLGVGLSGLASGADKCSPVKDSIFSCWHKYNLDNFTALNTAEINQQIEERKAEKTRQLYNDLLSLVTGSGVFGSNTASAVNNFLPLLAFTGFSGRLDGNDSNATTSDKDLAFDLNLPFFGSSGANALKLQAAFARDPEIYQPLLDAAPEESRDAFKTSLSDGTNLGDDARFTVSYGLVTKTFGRSFNKHRSRFEALYTEAISGVKPLPLSEIITEIQTLSTNAGIEPPGSEALKEWTPVLLDSTKPIADSDFDRLKVEIMSLVEQAARINANTDVAENERLQSFHVLKFRDLIDSQPQLLFNATVRERDIAIGPDEFSLSAVFEFPLGGNLWGFSRKFDETGKACDVWASNDCLEAYRDYVGNQSTISQMSPRFSLSIEYVDIDDYNAVFEDPMVSLSKAGSEKLIATAGFGLRFNREDIKNGSRLDFSIKYEDVSDDPLRNDRVVGSATWTKQFGDISVPISLVYSNKSEFINQENIDEKLSAHIGMKYEFKQKQQ